MRSECFLDTNILVYAATAREDDPRKYAVAQHLILTEHFGLSGQVLAEFFVNVRKKPAVPLSLSQAEGWIELLGRFPTVPVDHALVRQGIAYASAFRVSYWDAALIAAAERLDAPILYTEDLNHGQTYGSVQVINPFRPS